MDSPHGQRGRPSAAATAPLTARPPRPAGRPRYYAYEETLATFGDEAGLSNSLLSAFERLTAVVTQQEITSMPQ
ncbi:hypothetical protein DLE01_33155, partial [Streptomyces sp. FT05W]